MGSAQKYSEVAVGLTPENTMWWKETQKAELWNKVTMLRWTQSSGEKRAEQVVVIVAQMTSQVFQLFSGNL